MKYYKTSLLQLIGPLLALLLSFLIGGIFIFFVGRDPILVYERFFSQTLGNAYGMSQVLFKATPLMFTGLCVALSFRAGLFNIGAEGQLIIGTFLTAWVGFTFNSLPALVLIPFCLIAGILGGAFWGAIPGVLKAKFGAHEVINTIMMNFIAAALVSYLVINVYAVPATIHTPQISPASELPRLDFLVDSLRGSPANVSVFLALTASIFCYYFLWKTRWGYELRALGLSRSASEYAGINIGQRTIMTLALSGGIAGLVGSNFVMGYKHYFELGFSEGIGYIGIAVALLAKNHPLGIILTAVFFGILEYGTLTIGTFVPKELSNILQAIVILFVLITSKLINWWIRQLQALTAIGNVHA
ncbi:MAG: ABC transporter permease [Ignavibacteriae bacterium]|nr:ABC transporter permease [Ignavibacteriota bacterium]